MTILIDTCSHHLSSFGALLAFFVGMNGTVDAELGAGHAASIFVDRTNSLFLFLLNSFFDISSALFNT